MHTKFCRGCQVEKPTDQFHQAKKEKDGLQYRCIECSKQYHAQRYIAQKETIARQIQEYRTNNKDKLAKAQSAWRRNNPDKVKTYQRSTNLKKQFGLSIEQYEAMSIAQNHCCAICKQPETFIHSATNVVAKLAVDHCHKTGAIRKLLCKNCNNALGMFKDNIHILSAAIDYLESHYVRS
jgi:hypothetical protein